MGLRLSIEEFCAAVEQVIAQLPGELRGRMENLVVDVEPLATRTLMRQVAGGGNPYSLMGVFLGRSLLEQEYGENAPNRIVLFQRAIEAASRNRDEVLYEIRRTVLHELAHHFGFSEEDLEDFESQPSPFDDDTGAPPPQQEH